MWSLMVLLKEYKLPVYSGARCNSVVECPFMVQWVVGSLPYGGPIDIFLNLASAAQLV